MRILQINKFFHTRGGADTLYFKTCNLLAQHGHAVAHFSTRHAKNVASPYERYFVNGGFTEDDVAQLTFSRKAAAFVEGIYSRPAYRSLRTLVDEFRPDVAHVHNLNYQLTPSIFDALHDAGVPSVMTLHDYNIICGAGTLYVGGRVCERCRGGRHYNALLHRCFHQSVPASLMTVLNKYVHAARGTWQRISRLISPSQFLRSKLIEFGIAPDTIAHLPNFVDFGAEAAAAIPGEYVLYFGRLAQNKGITSLLEACEGLSAPVMLVGDGPLRPEVERCAAASRGLVFRDFVTSRAEMKSIIARAMFVVVPSTWYENQPQTVLEAYAMGKPVVASRLGGIPELVDDGETGLLFEPGDAADLHRKAEFLIARPELCQAWGEAGRCKLIRHFSQQRHYDGLMSVYDQVLGGAGHTQSASAASSGT